MQVTPPPSSRLLGHMADGAPRPLDACIAPARPLRSPTRDFTSPKWVLVYPRDRARCDGRCPSAPHCPAWGCQSRSCFARRRDSLFLLRRGYGQGPRPARCRWPFPPVWRGPAVSRQPPRAGSAASGPSAGPGRCVAAAARLPPRSAPPTPSRRRFSTDILPF